MRKETNIVIPVKDPRGAKSRLSEILSIDQRRELARFLFEGVLSRLREVDRPFHLLVVTDSDILAAVAKSRGAAVLRDQGANNETSVVDLATQWSIAHDFKRQIVIPADMGDLDPVDIETLIDAKIEAPGVILCPAVGDDGTNAILSTPPNALAFRFGKNSFSGYKSRAKKTGIHCKTLRLPSLVLDIDTPNDLKEFLALTTRTPAHILLEEWKIRKADLP